MEDETTKLKKRSLEEHPILDLNLPRKKKWKKQEEIIEDRMLLILYILKFNLIKNFW